MSKFVSVEAASELLDTTTASIMVTACAYKRDKGRYPKWYVSNAKRGAGKSWVDMEVLYNNRQLVRSIWIMFTDYLYWIIIYDLEMSEGSIAKQLAKPSKIYPNEKSWKTFIQYSLFTIPQETVYALRATMLLEFMKISKDIIAISIREEQ